MQEEDRKKIQALEQKIAKNKQGIQAIKKILLMINGMRQKREDEGTLMDIERELVNI